MSPSPRSPRATLATPPERGPRSTIPPQVRRSAPLVVGQSPRIAALETALRAGDTAAEDGFWREVAEHGTPLIEEVGAEHDGAALVTFLWHGDEQTAEVAVIANKATGADVLEQCTMARLPGSHVWHRTLRMPADWRSTYQLAERRHDRPIELGEPQRFRLGRAIEVGSPVREDALRRWSELLTVAGPDPLNRRRLGGQSIVELPAAPSTAWLETRDGTPRGRVEEDRLASRALGNERRVWAYVPAQPPPEEGYALVVLFDGEKWSADAGFTALLDNLIADGRIPPTVAVLPDALDVPTRMAEMTPNDEFVAFLIEELVPWASRHAAVTSSPERTVIGGQSLGGLTAAYAAMRAPERFGNVLAQSGSFWWMNGSPYDEHAEWLTHQVAAHERLPLRFVVEVGLFEEALLAPTRHLRDVLVARGYPLAYREYCGGHDLACWRSSLPEALIALLGASTD